jgi:hypothetical protein
VESIPGVTEVDPDVNANTSGTFITLKISANSYDEDELKSVAKEALTNILKDPRIGYASFSMGVFSPDDSINIAPSDVGCIGTGTTDSLRVLRMAVNSRGPVLINWRGPRLHIGSDGHSDAVRSPLGLGPGPPPGPANVMRSCFSWLSFSVVCRANV